MFIKKILLFTLLLCLCASPSYANAGIPVFMFLPTIMQNMAAGFGFLTLEDLFKFEYPFWILYCVQCLCYFVLSFFLLGVVASVEYGYLLQKLPKIEPKVLKKEVWHGNLITTLIGFSFWIPGLWGGDNRVGYLVLGPFALMYHANISEFVIHYLILPCYLVFIIYVCFVLSHRIEASFIRKVKGDYTDKEVNIAVKKANRRSYWSLIFFPAWVIFVAQAETLEKERMKQNKSGKV